MGSRVSIRPREHCSTREKLRYKLKRLSLSCYFSCSNFRGLDISGTKRLRQGVDDSTRPNPDTKAKETEESVKTMTTMMTTTTKKMMIRAHSFPRPVEFRAEPRNLGLAAFF